MPIHLYTEHLVNIRTLSFQASLTTVTNKETKATVSADGWTLSLTHEGETAQIRLPARIPGRRNVITLTIPAAPTKDFSFRFKIEEKQENPGLLPIYHQDDENIIPWTASSLSADTEISCQTCSTVVVKRGEIKIWKDLPSENWAEMMDFWHCHRPDVPSDHSQDRGSTRKGYSADSRLALASGVGMVDPVDFLFTSQDCENVTNTAGELECAACQEPLGHIDQPSGGYKLRKMSLSTSQQPGTLTSFPAVKWLACQFLSSIDIQGVRKFIVKDKDADASALECWIFTPDMNVSSSHAETLDPFRATKILWQECEAPAEGGKLDRQALSQGELDLRPSELSILRWHLEDSAKLMPENSREFQQWNVALLPRFTAADVGRDVSHDMEDGTRHAPEAVPDILREPVDATEMRRQRINVVYDVASHAP